MQRRARAVLPFLLLSPVKANLHANVPPIVRRIDALTRIVWCEFPEGLPVVEGILENMRTGPPTGQRASDAADHATAAHRPPRRRPARRRTPSAAYDRTPVAGQAWIIRANLDVDRLRKLQLARAS